MKSKLDKLLVLVSILLLTSCATKKLEPVSRHSKDKDPIIKPSDIVVEGQKSIEEKIKYGPKPYDTEFDPKENKRKTITSEQVRNYVTVPSEYENLKQIIDINFNGVDFRDAMGALADIGDINIIVGEEVSGTVTAKLNNVGWDVAFQTLLDMKTLGADVDVSKGIIRVHTPEKLTAQETLKSSRAEVLKKKIQLEDTVEPILAEIFRLYYISPSEAKTTLENLFKAQSAAGNEVTSTINNITITEESRTRSIIVRGRKPDLDVIDAVLREIDVKTEQVLIEAFIIDATSGFARELGARVGGASVSDRGNKGTTTISGMQGGTQSTGANAASSAADVALGAAAGTISGQGITGSSGIGILKQVGARALKLELEALETLNYNRILSQPSVFTLNNQQATITQGEQVPYQTTADGTTTTEFKEAALSLQVTPSIIGDGNVLVDIKVNNDSVIAGLADEPSIKTNEIITQLLVSDGDIVVIGGIKKNDMSNTRSGTPGVSKVPLVGNLFKNKQQKDDLNELLIFIAPRVVK